MFVHFSALRIHHFLEISRASSARIQLPHLLCDQSLWHPHIPKQRREHLIAEIASKGHPESIGYEDIWSDKIPVGLFLRVSKHFAGIRPNVPPAETAAYNLSPWATPREWNETTGFAGHKHKDFIDREIPEDPITMFLEESLFTEVLKATPDALNEPPGAFPTVWPAEIELEVNKSHAAPIGVRYQRIWDLEKPDGLAVDPSSQAPYKI